MATSLDHGERRNPELLLTDEVAAILRVAPRTVRRWGASGVLRRVRLGDRLTRYTVESVEALIHPPNDVEPAGNRLDEKVRDDGAHRSE